MYTEKQTKQLIEAYVSASNDSERTHVVLKYADTFGKTKQSIIAKLGSAKVYVKKTKTKNIESTKSQYINHIAIMLGINDASRLDSLEKASKQALELMSEKLNKLNDRHL